MDEPAAKPPIKRNEFFLSRLFFGHVDGLVSHGYRTRLEKEDLFEDKSVSTELLYNNFQSAYDANECQPTELKRLVRSVARGNAKLLIASGVLYIISQACTLAGPMLLQKIVSGLECPSIARKAAKYGVVLECKPKSQLYYYCIGLFFAPFLQSICENHYMYQLNIVGTRMRNALMAAIYRKCLRLSTAALQAESTGKVVTLMSNDAQKMQDAIFGIHQIWGSPLYIIAVLVLLYQQVAWATFVGLAIMILLVPASAVLAKKLGGLRVGLLKWTDMRVSRMSELIGGIQMIKFYAWEESFRGVVAGAREQEAIILRKLVWVQSAFGMLMFAGPVAVAVFCFGSYELAGNHLTTAKAYTALLLFTLLRFPMSFLPMIITMLVNALVGLRRIGGFLAKPEASLQQSTQSGAEGVAPGIISVKDADFQWEGGPAGQPAAAAGAAANKPPTGKAARKAAADKAAAETAAAATAKAAAQPDSAAADDDGEDGGDKAAVVDRPALEGITFDACPGRLTMVVGSVGSGKSSLLAALIGAIGKTRGSVDVGGRVAYVAQTAWIVNDTVQENVLLGTPLDPQRYTDALQVAQLGPDLQILPAGDLTEIGDRGITLSGGQKQRVSIARAVYADADVYILDDPLSAVDSHVGRALFDRCIRGALKAKTVVLVTNALQYLPHADNIIWLEEGRVRAQGSYQQLVDAGMNIDQLAQHDDEEGKEGEEVVLGGEKEAPTKLGANTHITLTKGGVDRNLTGEESREAGAVSGRVILLYMRAGGGWGVAAAVATGFALEQATRVYTDTWVGIWFANQFEKGLWFYLSIYASLGILFALIVYCRSIVVASANVRAAVGLHNRLLDHLLLLPKSFFDTNPAGRILNRFSRDVEILDAVLPSDCIQLLACIATYVATLVVICIATRWFAVALLPLTIIYVTIQRFYIPTARELQRIESVTRSPIYSRFGEALLGVSTIRAYRLEAHFTAASDRLMATNAHAYLTQRLAASWLAMRLDILGLIIIALAGFLVIQGSVAPGLAGLALVYALDLTRFLKHGTTMASKTEADLNSVERIAQYLDPPTEASPNTPPDVAAKMPPLWPNKGAIALAKVQMRYRPDTPLVLKGVSFDVAAGEKVGIVGRTGSGKSSLFITIFRMVEPEAGSIIIDGVDCTRIGLRQLRGAMSIIPQDPFMFSGTVRHNLDPFGAHADAALWEALRAVGLGPVVEGLEHGMGANVVDNGANFSQGQRQLFCLARAMLRRSKLLMLDEATASIDPETDAKLQAAIRSVFASTTMLTIAHRLNTIMDSDKVLVMDAGVAAECDEPHALLAQQGLFSALVEQTGKQSAAYLRQVAQDAGVKRSASRSALSLLEVEGPEGSPPASPPSALKATRAPSVTLEIELNAAPEAGQASTSASAEADSTASESPTAPLAAPPAADAAEAAAPAAAPPAMPAAAASPAIDAVAPAVEPEVPAAADAADAGST